MIIVCMHSYNRLIAGVVPMIDEMGGTSFLTNLGSSGVKTPNNLIILINIQLFVELVRR